MLRFQADADLRQRIVAGVLAREPAIDFQTAAAAQLAGVPDPDVLSRASRDGRILVSHDVSTMPVHFAAFLARGLTSPGLLLVSQEAPLRPVIDALILIWSASAPMDWANQMHYLPSLVRHMAQ